MSNHGFDKTESLDYILQLVKVNAEQFWDISHWKYLHLVRGVPLKPMWQSRSEDQNCVLLRLQKPIDLSNPHG